ncbi:MAG: hypothetical protein ACW986_17215 [Promethearchaeota archaeon]|jgi:EAL domain-containing protein (putative c-di-GMP-specific phosphodiesterase class I)
MDYSDLFYEMLQFLQHSYKKFPKFLIEITAENYDIPIEQIKPLLQKFRKEGILLILKDEGYTFMLNTIN